MFAPLRQSVTARTGTQALNLERACLDGQFLKLVIAECIVDYEDPSPGWCVLISPSWPVRRQMATSSKIRYVRSRELRACSGCPAPVHRFEGSAPLRMGIAVREEQAGALRSLEELIPSDLEELSARPGLPALRELDLGAVSRSVLRVTPAVLEGHGDPRTLLVKGTGARVGVSHPGDKSTGITRDLSHHRLGAGALGDGTCDRRLEALGSFAGHFGRFQRGGLEGVGKFDWLWWHCASREFPQVPVPAGARGRVQRDAAPEVFVDDW